MLRVTTMKVCALPIALLLITSISLLGESAEIKWQWNVGDASLDISQAPDGTLIAIGEHQMTALDPNNGQFIWQKTLSDPEEEINSPPTIGNQGTFYQRIWHDVNKTNRFAAISIETGEEAWSKDIDSGLQAIWEDLIIVPTESKITALSQADGSIQWEILPDIRFQNSVTVVDDVIFTTDGDGNDNYKIVGIDAT